MTRGRPRFSLGEDVIEWITRWCVHGPGDVLGAPVELTKDEMRFLLQAYEVDETGRRVVRRAVRGLPKGSRKALALDTPLPTPLGWTTVGEVRPGDFLFDESGRQCRVLQVHPVRPADDCYRLMFDDGTSIVANGDHGWMASSRRPERRDPQYVTTREMFELPYWHPTKRYANWRIAVAGPLDCADAYLPVDPYVLGYWLGDGHSGTAQISAHWQDIPNLVEQFAGAGITALDRGKDARSNAHNVLFGRGVPVPRKNTLTPELSQLGVTNAKHIPAPYMRASAGQRLALLQGLMDSDGYVASGQQVGNTQKSEILARQIVELARSLGFKPRLSSRSASIAGKEAGRVWEVFWSTYSDWLPVFRLPRKLERLAPPTDRERMPSTRKIVSIEQVDSVPTRCLTVDSPSHLFLAGEGMIPTHNTEFAAWVALAEMAGPVRFSHWEDGRARGRAVVDPYVVAAAASYEQADLLFSAARSCITEGPLKQHFDSFDKEIQLKKRSGVLLRVPAVAGTNDGLRPTFVVADETHEWTGSKARVHLVLENGLAKRQDAWSLSITTAGNPKVDSVALSQYEYGKRVESGELDDPGFLFSWREPKVNIERLKHDEVLRDTVLAANPEPWKRTDDLVRRFHEVPLHEFCRYHLNMWVEPDQERWLPPGAWKGLLRDFEVPEGAPVVLGFDGSYSGDSTALVGATVEEQPHLFVIGLWEHPGGGQQWQVDHDEVERVVHESFRKYRVVEMSADPPYWSQQLARWAEMYGEDVVLAFNTYVRKRMAAACSSFYQAATTDGLTHDGNPALARHVDNAVLKETAQGAYITKEDKSSPRKIDAAIAAVIAYNRAVWHHQFGSKPVNAGVLFL